jgi:hypothetical protein
VLYSAKLWQPGDLLSTASVTGLPHYTRAFFEKKDFRPWKHTLIPETLC